VWYAGERVTRVAEHPVLGRCVANRAREMALYQSPAYRDLLCVAGDQSGHSVVHHPPQSSEDLVRYRKALELALDETGGGVADRFHYSWGAGLGLFFHTLALAEGALAGRTDSRFHGNLRGYLKDCQERCITMTTAFSEAKGDRRKPPWEQEQYLQVVAERDDG